jgi:hypothetical protein
MDASEPRVRRRGFFFHVEPHELDPVEHEAAEGISIRLTGSRKPTHAIRATSLVTEPDQAKTRTSAIRSGNETGSRQPAGTSR